MAASLTDQLIRVEQKLKSARKADSDYSVFGAAKHRYRSPPALSEADLIAWESEAGIRLPEDYRAFLSHICASTDREAVAAGPY